MEALTWRAFGKYICVLIFEGKNSAVLGNVLFPGTKFIFRLFLCQAFENYRHLSMCSPSLASTIKKLKHRLISYNNFGMFISFRGNLAEIDQSFLLSPRIRRPHKATNSIIFGILRHLKLVASIQQNDWARKLRFKMSHTHFFHENIYKGMEKSQRGVKLT